MIQTGILWNKEAQVFLYKKSNDVPIQTPSLPVMLLETYISKEET